MYELYLYRSTNNPLTIKADRHTFEGNMLCFYNEGELVEAYNTSDIKRMVRK